MSCITRSIEQTLENMPRIVGLLMTACRVPSTTLKFRTHNYVSYYFAALFSVEVCDFVRSLLVRTWTFGEMLTLRACWLGDHKHCCWNLEVTWKCNEKRCNYQSKNWAGGIIFIPQLHLVQQLIHFCLCLHISAMENLSLTNIVLFNILTPVPKEEAVQFMLSSTATGSSHFESLGSLPCLNCAIRGHHVH